MRHKQRFSFWVFLLVLILFSGINLIQESTQAMAGPDLAKPSKQSAPNLLLIQAAEKGDAQEVKRLLEHGANVNDTDRNQETALHLAAWGGHRELVKFLLEHGAAINARDENGQRPLELAIERHQTQVAEDLIASGADVNGWSEKVESPLHTAASSNSIGIAKLLTARGAKVNFLLCCACEESCKESGLGTTPLHFTADQANRELAEILLAAGADPNIRDCEGKTPLRSALESETGFREPVSCSYNSDGQKEDKDIAGYITLLLAHGAETDFYSEVALGRYQEVRKRLGANPNLVTMNEGSAERSPLHWAAQRGQVKIARILISKGASVNAITYIDHGEINDAITPLHDAAEYGQLEMVKFLIAHGAKINTRKNPTEMSIPLNLAIQYGHTEVARYLIEHGADARDRDEDNVTPLWWAANAGDLVIMKLLLAKGADVNLAGYSRETPLYRVAGCNDIKVVKLLLDHGADIEKKEQYGSTPLFSAIENPAITEILLAYNANANVKNQWGSTPLHNSQNPIVTELLIAHGADVQAKDNHGMTPLELAVSRGLISVVKVLLDHGAKVNENTGYGLIPLHLATDKEVAELLISRGAEVNSRDNHGLTPLHFAVCSDSSPVVEVLLSHGAEVNAEADYFGTPLKQAEKRGNHEIEQLLLAHGAVLKASKELHNGPGNKAKTKKAEEKYSLLPAKSEDYRVWSALINQKYFDDYIKLLVVDQTTNSAYMGSERLEDSNLLKAAQQVIPELQQETIDDFAKNNKEDFLLDKNFRLKKAYQLIGGDDYFKYFSGYGCSIGWQGFYEDYPGSQGIMSLSRVGYNSARDQALVYVGNQAGRLDGAGFLVLLLQEQGAWKIKAEYRIWVS